MNDTQVITNDTVEVLEHGKIDNNEMIGKLKTLDYDALALEMIASYGMAVGSSVFDTVVYIGRFKQIAIDRELRVDLVFRKEVMKAMGVSRKKINGKKPPVADSQITQTLVKRFARHNFKNGKGTKANPDYFYGFKGDVWQAFGVLITYLERGLNE